MEDKEKINIFKLAIEECIHFVSIQAGYLPRLTTPKNEIYIELNQIKELLISIKDNMTDDEEIKSILSEKLNE